MKNVRLVLVLVLALVLTAPAWAAPRPNAEGAVAPVVLWTVLTEGITAAWEGVLDQLEPVRAFAASSTDDGGENGSTAECDACGGALPNAGVTVDPDG